MCDYLRRRIQKQVDVLWSSDIGEEVVRLDDIIEFIIERDKDVFKTLSIVCEEAGSQNKAADMLGVNRSTVSRYIDDKMGKYHHVFNGRMFTAKGNPV